MYARNIKTPPDRSFFLFGPRGTGKSTWVRSRFPDAAYVDLLRHDTYVDLTAQPDRLADLLPANPQAVYTIVDEVQKVPALLDVVQRLIGERGARFLLTGSSARKLRRGGANLLAGRAYTKTMCPLSAAEMGDDYRLDYAVRYGMLPDAWTAADPNAFLKSYVATYLKEEVQQEGLTRNIGAFVRFLETAAFSQGSVLNMSHVARECGVHRKVAEDYFSLLEDLLLAERLPVFSKRAQRQTIAHPKFYFFDAGVYNAIRPRGPLDGAESAEGIALETLVYQELRAANLNFDLGYDLSYWRTPSGVEVDFVLYGERGLIAVEVKRSRRPQRRDTSGLRAFCREYPMAVPILLHLGPQAMRLDGIAAWPIEMALRQLPAWLASPEALAK